MNQSIDRERLQRLLGRPELKRLLDRLQLRLERGDKVGAAIQLTRVQPEERRGVETLLGRPAGRGASLRIPVTELETILQRGGIAPDLRSAVVALRGPLKNRRAEEDAGRAAWQHVFAEAEKEAKASGLSPWLDKLRQDGLLKRLAKGDADKGANLLRSALHIMQQLPVKGISLSRLAAHTLGDAHALDPGRPVATLVQRAILALGQRNHARVPEGGREIWSTVGVLVGGSLSSTVLSLNLPVLPEGITGQTLCLLAGNGEPGWLTLRQLLRDPPVFSCRNKTVFICENPSVVFEAAEELGPACPALVCTNGQRNTALMTLLGQMAAAGARLVYHGDFDWPGIAIANGIMKQLTVRPWRFDTATYLSSFERSGKPLVGAPIAATWDDELASVMTREKMALEEEHMLDLLLEDLRCNEPQNPPGII